MKAQFLCYSKCGTCRKARTWLKDNEIEFEERSITDEKPSEEELKEWIARSGYPIKRFFNTSGNLYKQLKLKDKLPTMTEEEQIKLLSTDGMLVKRPILITEDRVLVGFKENEYELLK